MILVINEWIFHDLLFENGKVAFEETAKFVASLAVSSDRIVVPTENRWRRKALQLESVALPALREASQEFLLLFYDSTKSIVLRPEDISPTSPGTYGWAPSKDVYLIEACEATKADLLVTTDQTLFDRVTERGAVACRMRDDFLSNYQPTR